MNFYMGKIIPYKLNNFSGGISDSPRNPSLNQGSFVSHFDCFSDPNKLTPNRSTEADTSTSVSSTDIKQYDVRDFQLGSNGKLYGLGKTGAGLTKIFSKADPTTGNWTVETTAEGNGAVVIGCFIEWQGAWWFFQGTNQIGKWVIATNTITNSVATVGSTITSVAQGVISNNVLYMFYNNKVVSITAAESVSDNVFTAIPSDMRITSVARYSSYLGIGCGYGTSATTKPVGRSIVVICEVSGGGTARGEGPLSRDPPNGPVELLKTEKLPDIIVTQSTTGIFRLISS